MQEQSERAYLTCLNMLKKRNYKILNENKLEMQILCEKINNEKVLLLFNTTPKFDTKSMKEIISMMNKSKLRHVIVIYKDTVTPATKNILSQSVDMYIELFAEEDLQIDITEHILQPKFECLSDVEAEEFKKKYGIKFGSLRVDRPISRFYDYKKGDIIRIIRKDGYISYRIVKG